MTTKLAIACIFLFIILPISVYAAAATHFSVTGNAAVNADTATAYTVTALDGANATDTGYTGTVSIRINDNRASYSTVKHTYTGGDAGVFVFTITPRSTGSRTISALQSSNPSINGSLAITVNAAAATTFDVQAPAGKVIGAQFSLRVSARDAYGNVVTGYAGTVHFSSSGSATLPSDYTFTGGDAGVHTFLVTGNSGDVQVLTVEDTLNALVYGSVKVTINPYGFADPEPYPTGATPRKMAVGDYNNDGWLDVAVGNDISKLNVFLNREDGRLADAVPYTAAAAVLCSVAGDFNEDGFLDVVSCINDGTMGFFKNTGGGKFAAVSPFAGGGLALNAYAADLNRDSHLDLVVLTPGINKINILLGNGDGHICRTGTHRNRCESAIGGHRRLQSRQQT